MFFYLLLRWDAAQALPAEPGLTSRGFSGGKDVLLAWLASGVVVALLGVGQWLVGAVVPAGGVGRVTGVYYSPNHLALYLERIWPLALVLALYGGLERRWRWAAWAGVAVLSAGLYLTYSRAAWLLAIPLAVLVVVVSYRARLGQRQGRRWWVTVVLLLVVLLVAVNVLLGRLMPLSAMRDEIRLPVWQSTVEMIADHPWMGVGLDGFRFVYPRYMREEAWTEPLLYHPHNAWLDAAVRLGAPGLLVFALLVALCLVGAVRLQRETRAGHAMFGQATAAVAVGCLASLAAGLAHGLVDSGYFVGDLAWVLALVAGLMSGPCRELAQSREA
jgi:O-antigen ligase